MKKFVFALLGLAILAAPQMIGQPAYAQEAGSLPHQSWSFNGPFGTYDRAALQRGFQIYSEVCSNCHSMRLLSYRDLTALGYTEDEVKAIAGQKQVTDGPNDQGDMFQRPAQPSDHFVPPYPNDQANRAAHNGALPPDLSLIIKAREGGADYVYDLLTGYTPPPPGVTIPDTMQYNTWFPGHQLAMPPPLSDDVVTFADGTKASLQNEAHDVVTFLSWAAEPRMEERKRTGAKVLIFLLVMTGVLYAAKRKIWADVH